MIGTIVAKYLGGRALKAVSSAMGGAVFGSGLLNVFAEGVITGAEPSVSAAGAAVGSLLGMGIQYLLTYLPKNTVDEDVQKENQ